MKTVLAKSPRAVRASGLRDAARAGEASQKLTEASGTLPAFWAIAAAAQPRSAVLGERR